MPVLALEAPKAGNVKTFMENERKSKNDYNVTINYELGMHSRLPH